MIQNVEKSFVASKASLLRGLAAGVALAALPAAPAFAVGTAAGTQINNTATALYEVTPGNDTTVTSNTTTILVDELLDVVVDWTDPANVIVQSPSTDRVLTFTVTNSGNGSEAFALSTNATFAGDDFNPTPTSIYLDTNGSGTYDPGVDTLYTLGVNDPTIAADASITVFILSTIPGSRLDGDEGAVDLTAAALTGNGTPPGTTIPGAGQGGGNAVIGPNSATDTDRGFYEVANAVVALAKTQSVVNDPVYGTNVVPGAVITYTLVATVSGTGTLNNLRIADAIPVGSDYVPGSLTLEGLPLTDAADADAGTGTQTSINVSLGNLAAPATRTVTFQVEIED